MKITLRERMRANGNKSLYLDIYHEGMRKYEQLGLYLVPEVDAEAKKVNKNALKRANAIKADYILHPEKISMKKGKKNDITDCAYPNITTLPDWLAQYASLMLQSGVSKSIITQVEHTNLFISEYLKSIKRERLSLKSIDTKFVKGFLVWLRKDHVNGRYKHEVHRLTDASLHQYQMRFNCVLNRAVREGLIKKNPFYSLDKTERYSDAAVNREYLTKDELQRFLSVETDGKATQQAFGFASFTGLRLSDIEKLTWGNIRLLGNNRYVFVEQQKTGEYVMIPLGNMAQQYLPQKPAKATPSDKVFAVPTRTAIITSCKWIAKRAGINKNVSFHTSRHTFATLTHQACRDIKMVSQLLGHKSVETTQVYAEVQMANKVEVVNHLNGNFE